MDKDEIRKQILKLRDGLTKDEMEERSRLIFERLSLIDEYIQAQNILIYASMGSEVITDDIILDSLANGRNVFCPKVTDKNNGIMEFVRISSLEELTEGYFSIREPELSDESEVATGLSADTTLVIMPGVAFDRSRNRIGYGGGYYDRCLAKHSDLHTIAICYDLQIVENGLKIGEHDIRPDKVITESTVFVAD